MDIKLKNVTTASLSALLELNNLAVPQVNRLDIAKMGWFYKASAYFRMAVVDSRLAGFLIALSPDCNYESQYFDWFCQRYTNFIYIDRIIVAEWARRRGVGVALYKDVEHYAQGLELTVASDVYSLPPNKISLAFHKACGYKEVGSQLVESGTKTVAKFIKCPE